MTFLRTVLYKNTYKCANFAKIVQKSKSVTYYFYFFNAKSLSVWMKKTFDTSPSNPKHYNYTAEQGGEKGKNFPTLLGDKKGIYILNSSNNSWATGHADKFFEAICSAGCHYNGPIESIDIWVLD